MPPSPRITVTLNTERYEALCASMGLLSRPPVRFITTGPAGKWYGVFRALAGTIDVFCNTNDTARDRLTFAQGRLVSTLLHELRHAWQQEQYGIDWYEKNVVKAENDANEYAEKNRHAWRGVIRLSRTHPSSGFSQLARHEHRRMV